MRSTISFAFSSWKLFFFSLSLHGVILPHVGQLQRMLHRLGFYANRKDLIVNEKKSEVMHFARSNVRVPVLT